MNEYEKNVYKNIFEYPTKKIVELELENQKLNNVLNELEKWLKEETENIKMNYSQVNGNYFNMSYVIDTYENILDKLNELKESDK